VNAPDENLGNGPAETGVRRRPGGAAPLKASKRLRDLLHSFAALGDDLAAAASGLLGRPVRIIPARLTALSYAGFLASLEEAACCWLLSAEVAGGAADGRGALGGVIWLELSPALVGATISSMLDGRDEPTPQCARAPTQIERRLIRRFMDMAAEAIARTWRSLRICSMAEDSAPGRRGADPDEPVLAVTFAAALGGVDGAMRLCLPRRLAKALGPIARAGRYEPTGPGADGRPDAPDVVLSVTTPDVVIPAEDIADLAPGDVLVTDTPAEDELTVRLEGKEQFAAHLGLRNGKRAITITRRTGSQPRTKGASDQSQEAKP